MVNLTKDERAKVLDTLNKLMEHTDISDKRTFNVNEMAIANRKIKELCDRYGITIEEIRKTEKKESLMENSCINVHYQTPKKWIRSLANRIAGFYDCRVIRTRGRFHFIGFSLDSEVSAEVFHRLYDMISAVSSMSSASPSEFAFGAVISLGERLEEAKRKREVSSAGMELVIVKKNSVDEEVNRLFPKVHLGSKTKFRMTKDFLKGVEYGKEIEIFKGIKEDENNLI